MQSAFGCGDCWASARVLVSAWPYGAVQLLLHVTSPGVFETLLPSGNRASIACSLAREADPWTFVANERN